VEASFSATEATSAGVVGEGEQALRTRIKKIDKTGNRNFFITLQQEYKSK
jgi:hypothetical protein